jgi:hypothetical protein
MKIELNVISDMAGRTIEKVTECLEKIYITFTDNTFILLIAESDNYSTRLNKVTFCIYDHEIIDAGIMSEEEFNERNKHRHAKQKEYQEKSDRERYEELKAKFEGKEKS